MSEPTPSPAAARWQGAWPDALAFGGGLALAWFGQWQTKDLVWSLWLSSLLVGYAMIIWMVSAPLRELVSGIASDHTPGAWGAKVATVGIVGVGTLFGLAFFTVHFGGFHFVHSVFLNAFFPIAPGKNTWPTGALYLQVLRDYWPFVLVAAVAERRAFRWSLAPAPPDTSVKAADIAARMARKAQSGGMTGMMTPYRNVIRLHLLIFFFAFAHFAKLENFAVYAVVYAVYFFPWRLVRQREA